MRAKPKNKQPKSVYGIRRGSAAHRVATTARRGRDDVGRGRAPLGRGNANCRCSRRSTARTWPQNQGNPAHVGSIRQEERSCGAGCGPSCSCCCPPARWRSRFQDRWASRKGRGESRSTGCRSTSAASGTCSTLSAHGTPAARNRPWMHPIGCDAEAVRWFIERGFVVLAGMRRGYGRSGGPYSEGAGGPFGMSGILCDNADFAAAGLEAAHDLAAMVEYAATLPFARPGGMVVVGHSGGGWGAIAYDAVPHPRVTAFVNMAGGRGGHLHGWPNENCHPELLAEAAGRFARTSATPMLWIYTANDSYFAPPIAGARSKPPRHRRRQLPGAALRRALLRRRRHGSHAHDGRRLAAAGARRLRSRRDPQDPPRGTVSLADLTSRRRPQRCQPIPISPRRPPAARCGRPGSHVTRRRWPSMPARSAGSWRCRTAASPGSPHRRQARGG